MQKVFWGQEAEVSRESLAPSETRFAPVQPHFAPVQNAFSLPGRKRPFAPSPDHFLSIYHFRVLSQNLWIAIQADKVQNFLKAMSALSHPTACACGQASCTETCLPPKGPRCGTKLLQIRQKKLSLSTACPSGRGFEKRLLRSAFSSYLLSHLASAPSKKVIS